MDGVPEPYSTLTEDITVNIGNDVSATALYYYKSGTTKQWRMNIVPNGAGEGFRIALNATQEDADIYNGIPSGTYKAATPSYGTEAGEFGIGFSTYLDYAHTSSTWYAKLDEGGDLFDYSTYIDMAPAISGNIIIDNKGNGEYKIEFECIDDAGYTFSGTWEGTTTLDLFGLYYW